ncbi:hypothetical protein [Nocardioides sp. WS12]|uniref:hypothetical protein n=1 Tax=Nocardioides sp. WS12 TaxID=2486272 RepID=UPI0015FD93DD|nr:hypothetical protein [Nocardioides sp. WS12]
MEARTQRVLIWSGPLMVLLFLISFLFLAGFIPPSSPSDSAADTYDLYAGSHTGIKVGMVLAMIGSALLTPWGVAISGQIKRIRGARALADTQMLSSALGALTFIIPITLWIGAAYRYDERSADVTQTLHDIGWLQFVCVVWVLFIQMVAIGWAILIDDREDPVLPRWVGYLSLWAAAGVFPAGLVPFFWDGPFAWNGAIGFYLPLVAFCCWMLSTSWAVFVAVKKQVADGTEPGVLRAGACACGCPEA